MCKRYFRQNIFVISNSLLFLSSLFLLLNFAPQDLFPSYRRSIKAIQELKETQNILGNLPPHIKVKPGSQSMKISSAPDTFAIIIKIIKNHSPLCSNGICDKAIGVGYSTLRLPVGEKTLDAFYPLYIATMPTNNPDNFNLEPVGQLSDLEMWLNESHLGSLNITAVFLLVVGFFLQLLEAIWRTRK